MSVRAAIDVGSNSVKLLVVRLESEGSYAVVRDESRVTGLGRGLGPGGTLDLQAAEQTLACIADYACQAQALHAETIVAAGTSALRRAANAASFVAAVREACGVEIQVISGVEEARLAREIALKELPRGSADTVLFDVGGGSTELTWCEDYDVIEACSLELGARRCTDDAGLAQPVSAEGAQRLRDLVGDALVDAPGPVTGARLAGLGGTASELVWRLRGLRGEPKGDPHLTTVTLVEVEGLLARLAPLTLAEVQAEPLGDPARAEVIYAGAAIITGLCYRYNAAEFTLVDRGLRFGLALL